MTVERFTDKTFLLSMYEKQIEYPRGITDGLPKTSIQVSLSSGFPPLLAHFSTIQSKIVNIKDLIQYENKVMFDKYFLCRVIASNHLTPALHVLVDDPGGTLAAVLCFCKNTNVASKPKRQDFIPIGTNLTIRNPSFQLSDYGSFAVRCDNSMDVFIVDESMKIYWKTPIPANNQHPSLQVRSPGLVRQEYTKADELKPETKVDPEGQTPKSDLKSKDPEVYNSLGNRFFRAEQYTLALESYTRGLMLSPEHINLLSNRIQTNLTLGNFKEALNDAEALLQKQPDHVKALYRKALSLINLKKYKESVNFMQSLKSGQLTKELYSLKTKIVQQLKGIYDMKYFLDKECDQTMKTYPACAEFYAKTKLVKIPGKDRGLLSVGRIKAGQLIMASKAFVYDDLSCKDAPQHYMLDSGNIYFPNYKNLVHFATQKLQNEPEQRKELYALYAGPQLGHLDENEAENFHGIDQKRIDHICQFNAFQCDHPDVMDSNPLNHIGAAGVWLKPSFMNHSCVNYNASWIIKKDFLFVRAIKVIKADEEITIPYITFGFPYHVRQKQLSRAGFECTCDLCVLEKSETEGVHSMRMGIFEWFKSIPDKALFSHQQVLDLKRHRDQLDALRPQRKLNFPLATAEFKLAQAYMSIRNHLEAAKSLENCYNIVSPYFQDEALESAANCVLPCIALGDSAQVLKLVARWKKQLNIVYGSDNLNFYGDIKERLTAHGFQF